MDLVIVILMIAWFIFSSQQKKNAKKGGKKPYHPHQPPRDESRKKDPLFTKGELSGKTQEKDTEEDTEGISTEGKDPCHSEGFVPMEGTDPCHPEETAATHSEEHMEEKDAPDDAYEMTDTAEDQEELRSEVMKGVIWSEILNRKY